jgi:tetratricopeptide (TPR) repeat protein
MATIFISYSHKDETWREFVDSHLEPARCAGELDFWHDRRITGGEDWEAAITKALTACRIFLLLVSRHSLSSAYIMGKEAPTALLRALAEGIRIYVVVLEPTHIAEDHWIRKFNLRPRDAKPLQEIPEPNGERNRVMASIVKEIVDIAKMEASARKSDGEPGRPAPPSSSTPPPAPSPSVFDIDHLPDLNYVELRGRETELARLDDAWADAGVDVLSLVAWGGAGKTAVVTEWLRRRREACDAEVVLGWSFYSQGSHQRTTSADGFLVWAADRLGLVTAEKSPNDLAEAIGEVLGGRRVLLVLDGLEPLQEGLGPQMGYLRDPALRTLLRRAANLPRRANTGLVLVTTRVDVADLAVARFRDTVRSHRLDRLSDAAGAALLVDRGVKGRRTDLEAAAHDFAGHALALTLLAGFLVRRHGGEVAKRDRVRATVTEARTQDEMVHGHAKRVMGSLDAEWLATAPLARAILFAIGLFDRPANDHCLKALREDPVPSGLAAFAEAADDEIAETIHDLRKVGLLAEVDPAAPASLDAHPLVREWFGERFHAVDAEGWRAAHGRLFDHLCATTHEDPDFPTLDQLQPLFQAIAHGCRAGRHQTALDAVYRDRICRRRTDGILVFHAQNKLGAVSASLAALAWFFSRPFDQPHPELTAPAQSWVLGEATFYLAQLGRFTEALAGLPAAEFASVEREEWTNATIRSGSLADTEANVGDLLAAATSADRSIEWADRALDRLQMIGAASRAADIAAARGDRVIAHRLFERAEKRQVEQQPHYPQLYSYQGWQFTAFLIEGGAFAEGIDRATDALAIDSHNNWLVDVGLDHSSLARAGLGQLLTGDYPAGATLHQALSRAHGNAIAALTSLRRANSLVALPQGHFALARIARACGDWAGATRELDEIEDFARPSGMKLVLCDLALERCRLALARIEAHAPLAAHVSWPITAPPAIPETDLRAGAGTALGEARDIVASCGYHRRDEEVAELADVLAGRRNYADLPPRV